jgi:aminopeptidase N
MNRLTLTLAITVGLSFFLAASLFAQETRHARAALTLEQARARAARISDIRYALEIEIDGEAPEFAGRVTSRFVLADAGSGSQQDLTVDFTDGSVAALRINGRRVAPDYNGFFLRLPGATLRTGTNAVEISFSHAYSSDGAGLYRFVDPQDGRHYLYTDFEPYNQNRLFPAFDQPDLKARFTTEVTAPADWQVIANVAESDIRTRDGKRVWSFPETLPISTYVYALHAGDYHRWDSAAGDIPLRLFARESLVPYVHPEQWFIPTQQGFAFYQDYFGIPYAFGKYDEIVVPHFNAGAMENVGAVTFSERYLTRGAVTRQGRRSIASVILHEMAHMWFGDLVTMDWWNGLWLNESFATFMATLSMAEATEFADEWQSAYRRTIQAYDADERETTHPIELPLPDTDAAFANFDAITYNKGSAVLTQLNQLVGPENFRRGVGRYLEAHAFGNTTIGDFLGAVSAAADMDLEAWAEDWLRTPGTNTVEVSYACDDGALSSATIAQDAPEAWPVLRRHRTQLGLYRFGGPAVRTATLPATYAGRRSLIDAPDLPCPDMIYANHGDWDFARVRLGADTIDALKSNLNRFDDALTRAMLWQSVYDLVLHAEMLPVEFIDFAIDNVGPEPVDEIAAQVLGAMSASLSLLVRIDAAGLEAVGERMEAFLWRQVNASPAGSDRQLLYFDNYLRNARSERGRERLVELLTDAAAIPTGITLDQDRRWSVLARLSGFGDDRVARLLEAERAADPTDNGRLSALSVTAAAPDSAQQRRLMERLLAPDDALTVADARAIASGIYPLGQEALQRETIGEVLDRLDEVDANVDPIYYDAIVGGLLGALCDRDYLDALDARIASADTLHPALRKALLDLRFEVNRCLAIAASL